VNPICPYCRTEIGSEKEERLDCPGCATPHHPECFAENGGCTVFGCSRAPADEAKISVTARELQPAPQSPVPRPLALNTGLSLFGTASLTPSPGQTDPLPLAPVPTNVPPPPPPPPPSSVSTGSASLAIPPPLYTSPTPPLPRFPVSARSKSRVAFVLLGVFLGFFGLHNFYAGYNKKGAIQLALTILTFFYAAVFSWVWAIVEVCVINRDSEGQLFA
jgi:TM2 domain-containing membrane protein YozV